jgi:hypothetical protein
MSRFEFILLILIVLLGGILWWLSWGKPVLYDRSIPPQEITSWQVLQVESWKAEDSFYQLEFSGVAVLGGTSKGLTVLVLLGHGHAVVKPHQVNYTGSLKVGPPPQVQSHPLPELKVDFSRASLRLSPHDPVWPQGIPAENLNALQQAQALHHEKLPRYLSKGAKVLLPMAGVRVIELTTEQGDLLLLDSPQRTAVYKLF